MPSHLRLLLAALAASCSLLLPTGVFSQTLQIDALKANYIDGFFDFIRWQGDLKSDAAAVGVIGSQELVNHLSRLTEQRSSMRSLTVRRVEAGDDLDGLDAVYISSGKRDVWPELREQSRQRGILLIGEEEGFASTTGSIEFVVVRNRLRFIVNARHAAECGIEFSSKLLELAMH